MLNFAARRIAQTIVVFFLFLTLTYFLIDLQPGDFADRFYDNPELTPETILELQERFGAGKSSWEQYITYIGNFFQGDFGYSFIHKRPVIEVIGERLPRTLTLFTTAAVISFYLGFIVGKFIAFRRGGFIEAATTISGVYLFTIFLPWFGLLALWLFAFFLDWVPLSGFLTPRLWFGSGVDENATFLYMILTAASISVALLLLFGAFRKWHVRNGGVLLMVSALVLVGVAIGAWVLGGNSVYARDILHHLVLPIFVLTAVSYAGTMLLTRNSMLETIREDYVMVARAKGLPEGVVRDKYVSRNAILPVVTALVFSILTAIDGGVITEGIFSWDGLGLTLLDSALQSDIPLAVGAFVFVGMFALFAHIIVDILYVFLDPRLKF